MKKQFYFMAVAAVCICGCEKSAEKGTEKEVGSIIYGSVIAEDGASLSTAAVLLTPSGSIKITGSDGLYTFAVPEQRKYEVKVFKEGFHSGSTSINVANGENELNIMLHKVTGHLSLNRAYVDLGANTSYNTASFSVINSDSAELAWSITEAAEWITKVEPASGTMPANSPAAVVITIDRSKLNAADEQYTSLVATASDGSTAELLVAVFGADAYAANDNGYIVVDNLYVQTEDIGEEVRWDIASAACANSTVGGIDDWRLPAISELALMFSKREAIKGFVADSYWSSTKYDFYPSYFYMSFSNGIQDYSAYTSQIHRCRCVRTQSIAVPHAPKVSTLAVTNITASATTLNGKIDSVGNPAYTEKGFVYSKIFMHPAVEDSTSITTKRIALGAEFSVNISGLANGEIYHVRAYATNRHGTAYGQPVSFIASHPDYIPLSAANIAVQKTDVTSGSAVYWEHANDLCENSIAGGYTDWRLPTIGELSTLFSSKTLIGEFRADSYWSNTPYSSSTSYHHIINFTNGTPGYSSSNSRARCVRTMP